MWMEVEGSVNTYVYIAWKRGKTRGEWTYDCCHTWTIYIHMYIYMRTMYIYYTLKSCGHESSWRGTVARVRGSHYPCKPGALSRGYVTHAGKCLESKAQSLRNVNLAIGVTPPQPLLVTNGEHHSFGITRELWKRAPSSPPSNFVRYHVYNL